MQVTSRLHVLDINANIRCTLMIPTPGISRGHGYDGTGRYEQVGYGGICGSGHPHYLLCRDCRDRYLLQRKHSTSVVPESVTEGTTDKSAPDLLGATDGGLDGNMPRLLAIILIKLLFDKSVADVSKDRIYAVLILFLFR